MNNLQTILIVDDLQENLRVLSSTLTQQGYRVRCVKNGSMALIGAKTALPDLILLDITMPDMNGYEVCKQLKATPETGEIPVIFLSALDEVDDQVQAFAVGGVDYITKPFHTAEVLVRVKNHLALQAAKAEISQLNAELEQRIQQRTAELQAINQQLQKEIHERQLAQQSLQVSEERLESILDSLQEVVWSVSTQTWELLYINPAVEKVYGRPAREFLDNRNLWLDVIHPKDRQKVEELCQVLLSQGSVESEYRILRPDGEVRWLCDRSHVVYDKNGVPLRLDGTLDDITQRKQAQEQLTYEALHDALTGLPNRTLFMQRVESALAQAKQCPDYLFAVLFVDLDRFKIVNDSLGHAVGDQLLKAIANLLKQCLRSTDIVARFGGDEFTIFLDDIKDINDAIRIAERLQTKLMSPFQFDHHTLFTSASIGIALSSNYTQAADLIRNADIAMYSAKEQGKRGHYAIFDQVMYERTRELLELENDLRQAINRQEFCLHYQPIISLVSGKLFGFEALVRWRHPQRGLIPPDNFISVAEDTSLIIDIGKWVLCEACQQLRTWLTKFPALAPLKISVNLTATQIKHINFVDQLELILAENGLDGSCLKLEITETVLVEYVQTNIDTLAKIKAKNIQLSIDDFGQGYSSLSYLNRLPIDTLKIDRSFVSKMNVDNENFEIVRTIITLAHTLGMDVTAEGVETATQLAQLKALGCEFGQGFLFSKPLNSASAEALMSGNAQWFDVMHTLPSYFHIIDAPEEINRKEDF